MNSDYSDMYDLPPYEPTGHPRMSRAERAAQFAPFQALSGYQRLIGEAGAASEAAPEATADSWEAAGDSWETDS